MSTKEDTIEINPALLTYLVEMHPDSAVSVRIGETVDSYALRCALEAGRQEIIDKIIILDRHYRAAESRTAFAPDPSAKGIVPVLPLPRTNPIQR